MTKSNIAQRFCNEKGQYHRLDGPALIFYDGTKKWLRNGKLHRKDGPAIIRPDKTEEWYLYGRRHRIDGPAYTDPHGTTCWYYKGVYAFSTEQFQQLAKLSGEDLTVLTLKYGEIK